MKISVCMATYNGEKYIEEQLSTIIKQLRSDDELIISDDSSTDNTIKIIEQFNDKRIKLYRDNKFYSPVKNFEYSLLHASGEVIVLADQDDVWLDNKLALIVDAFSKQKSGIYTVVFDNYVINSNGAVINSSLFQVLNSGKGVLKNFVKNTYLGCNMAISMSLLKKALPFPRHIPMHDIWIGILGNIFGEVEFIPERTMLFRRHTSNATREHNTLFKKIMWRTALLLNIILRLISHYKDRIKNGIAG